MSEHEIRIANPWKPDREAPTAEWLYDCPCGETHRLAAAVTNALRCGTTGDELFDEKRHRVEVKPWKDVFGAKEET